MYQYPMAVSGFHTTFIVSEMEPNVPTLVRMRSNNQNNLINIEFFFIFWPFTNIIVAVSWRGRIAPGDSRTPGPDGHTSIQKQDLKLELITYVTPLILCKSISIFL